MPDMTGRMWEDFYAMIDDIHAHVRATGREVEQADDPMRLVIGYQDQVAGKRWEIRLAKVKDALVSRFAPRVLSSGLVGELIKTAEGRRRLANLPLSPPVA